MKRRSVVRVHRLFDGHTVQDGPVIVLVEDGAITDVDLSGAAPPDGVPLTDLGDVTLLPGMTGGTSPPVRSRLRPRVEATPRPCGLGYWHGPGQPGGRTARLTHGAAGRPCAR
ncbi:hypothetical protein GCM10022232_64200 [Streptomyces plumbiresistens]|uniref:Uncharacterized protein n=1 Tax=Streptomyces plumbiresistens TaxID=511811 RepID=A0ABP7SKY4_9ACTN